MRQLVFEIGLADGFETGLRVEALEPVLRRDADAEAMEARESTVLLSLGFADPYAPQSLKP